MLECCEVWGVLECCEVWGGVGVLWGVGGCWSVVRCGGMLECCEVWGGVGVL